MVKKKNLPEIFKKEKTSRQERHHKYSFFLGAEGKCKMAGEAKALLTS